MLPRGFKIAHYFNLLKALGDINAAHLHPLNPCRCEPLSIIVLVAECTEALWRSDRCWVYTRPAELYEYFAPQYVDRITMLRLEA